MHLLQGLEYLDSVGEHAVCEQERVQEVYAQEAKVGQSLEQSLGARVADLEEDETRQDKTRPIVGEKITFLSSCWEHTNR